ncbi:hypothetical protein CN918_27130 [Priestia megaterium]|nr:hypothetical protein CN918_27130 [Priestia megaterium]
MNIAHAINFHPLFQDVKNLGFFFYQNQSFISETCKLELYFHSNNSFYSMEQGGYFSTLNTFRHPNSEKSESVNLKTLSLHLAYIGILSDNNKHKSIGTQLLSELTNLVDKYNIRMDLEIDDKFGVPFQTLKKWYEKFDFIYLGMGKMIRFSKSEREIVPSIPGKEWISLLFHVRMLYDDASFYDGHSKKLRKEYEDVYKLFTQYIDKELWSIPDLFLLNYFIGEASTLITTDGSDHFDKEAFNIWANDILQ